MPDRDVLERMRADWNQRAREDANYYVAFGRREQEDDEFFASAADVVRSLEAELKRLPAGPAQALRALEIGCGPGRLMKPMSRHFGEIHGVDVSDEMVHLAREKLRGVSNAHVHHTSGTGLSEFPDDAFDFVYSYAVFQHIPSRDVVFEYLLEARRVLKAGGILRCQVNGLPQTAAHYTTWEGVRIPARDVAEFAREHDFQLLALEGVLTQYMWTTWRKQPLGWSRLLHRRRRETGAQIRAITNAHSGEPAVPAAGRFAAVSLWVERLPADCDLNYLEVRVDGAKGTPSYIGPPMCDGLCQLNAALPPGARTGLAPIEIDWLGEPLCAAGWMRVVPPGPAIPRVKSVTDGINLLSGNRISSGTVKIWVEELAEPERFRVAIDGLPPLETDYFCIDPLTQSFEINFKLPPLIGRGWRHIRMALGSRTFAPVAIEVI